MANDKIKVLLAMEADDGLAEYFMALLEEKGTAVDRIEIRTTKRLVRQYIQSNADVGAVVLSQHLGEETFSAKEIDEISVAAPHAIVIPIVDEEPGSRYMSELASLGVYNALYDKDDNDMLAADLIAGGKGRDKMTARSYYGIQGTERAAEKTDAVFDSSNAVDYLRRSEDDAREFRRKLLNLEKKLSPEELKQVFLDVPDSVFEMARKVPEYRIVCDMVAGERNAPREEKPARTEKVKAPKKGKKALPLPFKVGKAKKENVIDLDPISLAKEEEGGQVIDIGFISTNVGVGCTTAAIMCATSLAGSGKDAKKVAIIELDSADHNFEALHQNVTGHANITGEYTFTYGALDYYFNVRYDEFCDTYRDRYDIVVYDFGSLDDDMIRKFIPDMEKTYVVSSPKLWKTGELADFLRSMRLMAPEIEKEFVYLFPSISAHEAADVSESLGNSLCVPLPFDSNPFRPSGKTQRIFRKLSEGKYRQEKLGKKRELKQLLQKSGDTADGSLKKIFLAVSVLAMAVILAGTYRISAQEVRYAAMYKAAEKAIADRDSSIRELSDKIAASESSLSALEKQVVVIREMVYPGDLLTEENTEVQTIRTESEDSLYMSPDDIGKVAACVDMEPGTVVYRRQTAVPVSGSQEEIAAEETAAEGAAEGETAADNGNTAEQAAAETKPARRAR